MRCSFVSRDATFAPSASHISVSAHLYLANDVFRLVSNSPYDNVSRAASQRIYVSVTRTESEADRSPRDTERALWLNPLSPLISLLASRYYLRSKHTATRTRVSACAGASKRCARFGSVCTRTCARCVQFVCIRASAMFIHRKEVVRAV